MPLYIFECPEHGRVERLRPAGTALSGCDHCSYLMRRVYGYSMAITQPESDRRGMFRRFSEASADLAERGIDTSGAWEQSKRRANAMIAAGESPVRSET